MISKNDCLILLAELQDKGVDTSEYLNMLITASTPPLDVIKFINDNRQLELTKFYEKLRKSYNKKRSTLYISIMKENLSTPKDILATLASLNLQIFLFTKDMDNFQMFLKHARTNEINMCLLNYSKTYDLTPCLKLLKLIKADIIACEYVANRRQLAA